MTTEAVISSFLTTLHRPRTSWTVLHMRALVDIIRAEDGGRAIGLEGTWGSGKSTVVQIAAQLLTGFRPDNEALLAAGKPPKVALIAIMRKLIILANALLCDRRLWSPLPA